MGTTDNGAMASRFLQDSNTKRGMYTKLPANLSDNTRARMVNENTIKGVAAGNTSRIDSIVTKLLIDNSDYLRQYVIDHGEIPFTDPLKLAQQAVLIRAKDVAKTATVLDTTETDALNEIEAAETNAQDINSPDEAQVLPIPVQAALKIGMDYLTECHVNKGGNGKLASVMTDLSNNAIGKSTSQASNFQTYNVYTNASDLDGVDPTVDDNTDLEASASAQDAGSGVSDQITPFAPVGSIGIDTGLDNSISPSTGMPIITAAPAPQTNTAGIVNSGTGGSSLLGSLGGLFNGISVLAGQVTTAANSTSGAVGAVKNAVSNVGANAIATYIKNNAMVIIFVVIILVVLIIAIAHARRSKG